MKNEKMEVPRIQSRLSAKASKDENSLNKEKTLNLEH